jgi:regulator of PEP synthase PpsR (kinase-PPPase family)
MLPYIDTEEKLSTAIQQIHAAKNDTRQVIVFSTLASKDQRQRLINEDFFVLDLFATCLPPLQSAMQRHSSPAIGQTHGMGDHGMGDQNQYLARMDAVNFTLNVDDGLRTKDYEDADLILAGVSRDLDKGRLPDALKAWKKKLYGLVIDPVSLQKIRQSRMPDSRYASIEQCRKEIRQADTLYRQEKIPVVESSSMSVEELATTLMQKAGLQRQY